MTILDHKDLADAAQVIAEGGLVALPTETVYGLAADATNDKAVARIFEAKGRPQFNPLIIHVSGLDMARDYVEISPLAERLAEAFLARAADVGSAKKRFAHPRAGGDPKHRSNGFPAYAGMSGRRASTKDYPSLFPQGSILSPCACPIMQLRKA